MKFAIFISVMIVISLASGSKYHKKEGKRMMSYFQNQLLNRIYDNFSESRKKQKSEKDKEHEMRKILLKLEEKLKYYKKKMILFTIHK